MARKFRLALAIAGVLSLACAAAPALAAESASSAVRFVIPAGTLDHALQTLATQGRVQLMYAPGLVAQRRSSGMQADLPPARALEILLRDSGLQAVQVTPNTFLIERAPTPDIAPPTPVVSREPVELATVEVTGTHIPRASIDRAGQPTRVETFGRHDPCVGIRATPIAEAMLALVLMDHALRHRAQNADVHSATPVITSRT